ncbi:OsmC family protein [Ferrovum sp. PN-J185]|uniref:OsmC family protein n=1 Tax=Ferrovum sp. PN-J185 TaxID=1356306 RepID=UPI0007937E7E|nr:OsmC family protein [Ferrovum sp. PN-J185]KXW56549.1 OsmC-like protein [Ferrovum sp. PN-J185]MCC6068103.1 OsmC family protein [Ferrovum sp. PN-J185]MDE1891786.1 OsmC family protein [Betaproteobacteria bacterium]MDE2056368.1 OsmC family protein [Betaproteobacteria bacterium]
MSEKLHVSLIQHNQFQFAIHFGDNKPVVVSDEDAPLGQGIGPTPGQLLLAAVANCMADSLHFALHKFNNHASPIKANASGEIGRNAEGRLRVVKINIELILGKAADEINHLDRILDQFEDFCTVGKSVAQGIPLFLSVSDSTGKVLK